LLVAAAPPRLAFADEATLLAKEHFRRGTKLYDLGHFIEAAAEYERAYEAKESPALLYNLGQAYRAAGESQKALNSYRSYLRHVPDAPNRAEVVTLIDGLRKSIDAQKQAQEKDKDKPPAPSTVEVKPQSQPEPAQVTPPPPPPPQQAGPLPPTPADRALGKKLKLAGLGVAAVGVAGLVLGGTFAGLTDSANHDINNPKPGAPYDKDLESRGNTYQSVEIATFAVGGAALVTGVVLYVVGVKKSRSQRFAVAPGAGRGALSASASWEF
jgi:tetratricopeptide (TPR) repeat protein